MKTDTSLPPQPDAEEVITALRLVPHPEGGFYRETFRSPLCVRLPDGRQRSASTAILFLLRAGEFSVWHTVAQDELWHWHAGGPLTLYTLQLRQEACATGPKESGDLTVTTLGPDWHAGHVPQWAVPAGAYQAALCPAGVPYVLVGCMVAPGFEFEDLALPSRAVVLALFPQQADLIHKLTRL